MEGNLILLVIRYILFRFGIFLKWEFFINYSFKRVWIVGFWRKGFFVY